MVAFELNRTKLTFWNRFIGRYYLIAVADNTIIFLLLSLINVLNDFGSGFFYTLFEWGNQISSHRVCLFAIEEIIVFDICRGRFHTETNLSKKRNIFWFSFIDRVVFLMICSIRLTNIALQRCIFNFSFIVSVEVLNVGSNESSRLWKAANERVVHFSQGLSFIVIFIIDPI